MSNSLTKKRNYMQWVSATVRVQIEQETSDLTRPEGNDAWYDSETDGKLAADQQAP